MDPRVTSAWELLRDDIENYDDLWLARDSEGIGDHFRAWAQIEECWREGIAIDTVLASMDLAEIELESDAQRLFWLAGLPGAMADSNFHYSVSHISSILESLVFRHSLLRLDVSQYIEPTHYELVESLNVQYAATRLGMAAHAIERSLEAHDAADFLGLTASEVELVKEQLPKTSLALGRRVEELDKLIPAVERLRVHSRRPVDALNGLLARFPADRECLFAVGAFLALSGDARAGLEYLTRADEMSDLDSPGWRDFVMRYFYIDCCVALSLQPERTFGDIIELPPSQGFLDGMEAVDYSYADLYFACRSWMLLEGQAHPFSKLEPADGPTSHAPISRKPNVTDADALKAVSMQLEALDSRLTSLVDVSLDIRNEQNTVAEILTAAGETRTARAEGLLSGVPGWASLSEISRREILAGELEYRAYVAGERQVEVAPGIANLLARAIEREMRDLPLAFDPPQWTLFKEARNRADHPDQFGEVDLTRMRSYLLGLYPRKDSLLTAIAKERARQRPR